MTKIRIVEESPQSPEPAYSLSFEYTMKMLFGDSADHIAYVAGREELLKKWLGRAVQRFVKDINKLDTTQRHKEMLIMQLESIGKALKGKKINTWNIIFYFFNLTSRFIGYDYHKAQKLVTPTYFQTSYQNFWSGLHEGEDWKKQDERKRTFINRRINIIKQLKQEGVSDFDIAQIFNTTEYDIKKILTELKSTQV